MLSFRFLGAALAAALLTAPAPALYAQSGTDTRALIERMDRLQRDMDVMQRNLARGTAGGVPAANSPPVMSPNTGVQPSSGFVEQTEVRISALEGQMRDLTGRLEEALNRVAQATQRLDKLVGDVDFRLNKLEQPGAAAPAAPAAGQAPAAPAAPVVAPGQQRLVLTPGTPAAAPQPAQTAAAPAAAAVQLPAGPPETQYEFAYGLYQQAVQDRGDFGGAEQALRSFVTANGSHRLAGDAQYWLGETFYARRDWTNAAGAFAEQFRRFPQNAKAPDALLRLGQSLGQLNRKQDACGTLGELDRRYPNATQSIKIAATRERTRLQCS
ncbi:MAG: tol-pal system protein YbgF [Telmatospirillum sp.]|nr:tol-pal system protein YbgF [Telmatospirillum sp.]